MWDEIGRRAIQARLVQAGRSMNLRTAGLTDVGRRRRANEDCYTVSNELGLYLVADGMGGHKAGQVASELATYAMARALEPLERVWVPLTEKLRSCVAAANREIYANAQARPELAGMGTTLVALLAGSGRFALAHVGDSRAYLIRGGRIQQLTEDHSVVGELMRRSEISAEVARSHPHRHVLTRAIGVRREVQADLTELTSTPGDTFVLCSDGLTGRVQDPEIAQVVSSVADLDEACGRLVDLANERGGHDNITVVLIRHEKDL